MAPTTILKRLTRELPMVDSRLVSGGGNTKNSKWTDVGSWEPWPEFNATTLHSIYGDIVDETWRDDPDEVELDLFELQIPDENSLEHVLTKYIFPLVNAALARANSLMDYQSGDRPHVWRGGRVDASPGRPDWSVCSPSMQLESGYYYCFLPGDTKVNAKWSPDGKTNTEEEWPWPLRQVQTYARDVGVRYGFIITDAHLVALRFAFEQVGPGISMSRAARFAPSQVPSATTHERFPSATSDVSMAASTFSNMSFVDSHKTFEFRPPQYCSIPWSDHGSGKLTVRLGLFYLCLLARYSPDTTIGYDYPPLDSWLQQGGRYVHNSLGIKTKKPPRGAAILVPEGAAGAAEGGQEQELISFEDIQYDGDGEVFYEIGQDMLYVEIGTPVFDHANDLVMYYAGGGQWSHTPLEEAAEPVQGAEGQERRKEKGKGKEKEKKRRR